MSDRRERDERRAVGHGTCWLAHTQDLLVANPIQVAVRAWNCCVPRRYILRRLWKLILTTVACATCTLHVAIVFSISRTSAPHTPHESHCVLCTASANVNSASSLTGTARTESWLSRGAASRLGQRRRRDRSEPKRAVTRRRPLTSQPASARPQRHASRSSDQAPAAHRLCWARSLNHAQWPGVIANDVWRADSGSGGSEIDRNPNELSRAVDRADISTGFSSSAASRIEVVRSGRRRVVFAGRSPPPHAQCARRDRKRRRRADWATAAARSIGTQTSCHAPSTALTSQPASARPQVTHRGRQIRRRRRVSALLVFAGLAHTN